MKTVIVACGSGVATSQTIASKLNRLLKERGIEAKVEAINFGQVDRRIKDACAYICIINQKEAAKKNYAVPVLNGIAFLTGVGMKAELDKLIAAINAAD